MAEGESEEPVTAPATAASAPPEQLAPPAAPSRATSGSSASTKAA
jgi:hypothetical protein